MEKKRTKPKVEDIVQEIAEPICRQLDCEIFDIEYKKEGADWYLRVFIDRDLPVDHDLCYAVSEQLSDALDALDPIKDAYFLEVSSPGIERPLRNPDDYKRFQGENIAVKLFAAKDGKKEFCGKLLGLENGIVRLECLNKNKIVLYELPYDEIAKAHLFYDFNK